MTKKEKLIVGIGAAFTLAAGAATCVLIMGSKPQSDEMPQSAIIIGNQNLITELKVGRYYLQGGTDDEYIEVYPDKTMCLFGYVLPDDATDGQRESAELFTTRKYYALDDKTPFIGLSDKPCDTVSAQNKNLKGYGYIDENCITFSSVHKGKLNYIYRNE